MTLEGSAFSVQLTDAEIRSIAAAMHERYLNLRNRYRKLNTEGSELDSVCNNMQLARNLRDSLGALIGQSWLGEDY